MELMVLVRPDFLASLLYLLEKLFLRLVRAPKDSRLDWTPIENLLCVSVVPLRIYLGR